MKILKLLLAVLGVAGVIGAGVYTYLGWFELQKLVAVAESMRSAPRSIRSRRSCSRSDWP